MCPRKTLTSEGRHFEILRNCRCNFFHFLDPILIKMILVSIVTLLNNPLCISDYFSLLRELPYCDN